LNKITKNIDGNSFQIRLFVLPTVMNRKKN